MKIWRARTFLENNTKMDSQPRGEVGDIKVEPFRTELDNFYAWMVFRWTDLILAPWPRFENSKSDSQMLNPNWEIQKMCINILRRHVAQ